MVVVHSAPMVRTHLASRCSLGSLVACVMPVITIVLTVAVSYGTHSLWMRDGVRVEQPEVKFSHGFALLCDTAEGTYGYSTLEKFNTMPRMTAVVPTFRSSASDDDLDGLNDALNFHLHIPVDGILHVRLALFLSYGLNDKVRMKTSSMAYLDYSSPIPGGRLLFQGDLRVVLASTALPFRGTFLFEPPVFNDTQVTHNALHSFENLVRDFSARNVSARLDSTNGVWSRATDSPGFDLEIVINIPPERLPYKVSVYETLKFGWVQLFSVGYAIYFLLWHVQDYVFVNRIIPARVRREGQGKKHTF